mmetsp:Transcript_15912/g.38734  ORF Transcript_15912/g.38734 Transcript_15912/m.38734 type:complete len:244 (-) Transcript_15912:965-1696(-)
MKSATFLPLKISGTTSYFQSSSSRMYRLRRSCEYTPAPPLASCSSFSVTIFSSPDDLATRFTATECGITTGRATPSRGLGCATCSRLSTSPARRLASFCSTRCASSLSQHIRFTSITPSSLSVLMHGSSSSSPICSAAGPCTAARIPAMSAASSGFRSSIRRWSILLTAMTSGLLANSGLMEWNSSACCLMLYPHCSLASTMYRITARKCASAVILCISMVLRSSSGRSKIPGVSSTCQRRYL